MHTIRRKISMTFSIFGQAKASITLTVRDFITADESMSWLLSRRGAREIDASTEDIKALKFSDVLTAKEALLEMLLASDSYAKAIAEQKFDYLDAIVTTDASKEIDIPDDKYLKIDLTFTSTLDNIFTLLTALEFTLNFNEEADSGK